MTDPRLARPCLHYSTSRQVSCVAQEGHTGPHLYAVAPMPPPPEEPEPKCGHPYYMATGPDAYCELPLRHEGPHLYAMAPTPPPSDARERDEQRDRLAVVIGEATQDGLGLRPYA